MTAPVAKELLEKYGRSGPRYTSYPTAPHFTADVDREALADAWRASHDDLSLYMHVPFCQVRCTFCGCHVKITRDRGRSLDYVDRLLAEMDVAGQLVDLRRPLRQVQLGGGTPNFLLPDQMTRLIEGIRARTRPASDAEWAIECDPRTLDRAYVDLLLDLGMNRFSLGVQDLEPAVMAAVNRPQSLETVTDVVGMLRSRGPMSINIDLIHGLPNQTEATWAKTLASILDLAPSRLAVFAYAHVPWLKPHQVAMERHGLPDAALRARLASMAHDALVGAGYVEVGMDHYARPEDELARARRDGTLHRNFMGYTTRRGLDLVAVGTSAISRVGRSYAQDEKDLARWGEAVEAERMPWERGLLLSDDDMLRGEIITEISCNGRLDVEKVEREHGVDFGAYFERELSGLADMQRDGLLTLGAGAIELSAAGRYLVRNVCMLFDAWLPKDAEAAGPRYSMTT